MCAGLRVVSSGKGMAMNRKQRRFAQEYAGCLNATEAAIRAGYSGRTAYSQGCRLLKHDEVMAEVEQYLAEAAERAEISADWIIERLRHEATTAPTDGSRVRSLELLGRSKGLFVDRQETTEIQRMSDEDLDRELARHGIRLVKDAEAA